MKTRLALIETLLLLALMACGGGGSSYTPGPSADPPRITVQPQGTTLTEPAPLALSVTATGSAPLYYQWTKDGINLPGATGPSFGIALTVPEDSGSYTVLVSNSTLVGAVSSPAVVRVLAATGPPQFILQPQSVTVTPPASVTLTARAIGTRPIAYLWKKNGNAITGATGLSYSFQAAGPSDGGSFTVAATNGILPDALSQAAVVTVNNAGYSGVFLDLPALAFARSQHTATLLPSGLVLIAGGSGPSGWLDRAETFDPLLGHFTTLVNAMKVPRLGHTAILLANGTVLLAGGQGASGTLASAEIFDPSNGSFTLLAASLGFARSNHSATLLGTGKVLLAGGDGPFGLLSSAELYDPVAKTFTATGYLVTPRSQHSATLLANGQVLVAGGLGVAGSLDQAELFNPATLPLGAFTLLASPMSIGRAGHVALLAGAKVLLAGGTGNFGPIASAELFDPGPATFTATGNMTTARANATASLLTDGRILVVGGFGGGGVLASAEFFRPSTGTFAATSTSLTDARSGHTATVLPSGKVLIVGGNGSTGTLGSAALFQ